MRFCRTWSLMVFHAIRFYIISCLHAINWFWIAAIFKCFSCQEYPKKDILIIFAWHFKTSFYLILLRILVVLFIIKSTGKLWSRMTDPHCIAICCLPHRFYATQEVEIFFLNLLSCDRSTLSFTCLLKQLLHKKIE